MNMDIKTAAQIAKLVTQLGWISSSDWKTPRIISKKYREQLITKAVNNASKSGYTMFKKILKKEF